MLTLLSARPAAAQALVDVAVPAEAASAPQLWAGHVVVRGKKTFPILGSLEPQNDTYVLATVTEHGGVLHFEQQACGTVIAPMAGATVGMAPGAAPKLPGARFAFAPKGEQLVSERWISGWDETDVDEDGRPGVSIYVDAPLCGGALWLTSTVQSSARGALAAGGFSGDIEAIIEQHILGASNGCLRLVAGDSRDEMVGAFAYVPVPAGTTCGSYAFETWPARATLESRRR